MQIRLSAAAATTTDIHHQMQHQQLIARCEQSANWTNCLFQATFSRKCQIFAIFVAKQHQRAICQKHQLYMVSNKKSAQTLHQITTVTRYPPFSGLGFSLVINFNRGVWGGGSPPSASQLLLHTVDIINIVVFTLARKFAIKI